MHAANDQRRGWCPSLWTPMESGDGLIVRVRAAARALRSAELSAVAELAQAHGNGQIELTRRANLQLRGLTESALPALQVALVRLGLAEATPELEQRLALLVNPLDGLDPACAALAPLAAAIERELKSAGALSGLPSKFGIVLDGGVDILSRVSADIRVDLARVAPHLAHVSVAGDRTRCAPIGVCRSDDLPRVVWLLTQAAAELEDARQRQQRAVLADDGRALHVAAAERQHERRSGLRDAFAADGGAALRQRLGPLLLPALQPQQPETRARGARTSLVGFHTGRIDWFGLGVPFGSAAAETWQAIANLAERFGQAEVRVTPARSVLLPGVRARDCDRIAEAARQLGLITEADDPLLRVMACPGAPACGAAHGETRSLARSLGALLAPAVSLHVSGCSKGCACSGAASITLVHDADGCKLGFGLNTAETCASPVVPLELARRRAGMWAAAQASSAAKAPVRATRSIP